MNFMQNWRAPVVSVCEWQDPSLATFKQGRRDDALVTLLKALGCEVTYLKDAEATLEAMTAARDAVLPGSDNLLFYYQGHGLTEHGLGAFLANYDIDTNRLQETAFSVDKLAETLEHHWKGSRLLLIGDCCFSGSLAGIVRRLANPAVACLPSVKASNSSTGHWTFTEGLILALLGDGRVDVDGDGHISFADIDSFLSTEMRYRENQLTHGHRNAHFDAGFVFRPVDPARARPRKVLGPWKSDDYCQAQDCNGEWFTAQILDIADEQYQVHFLEFADQWDEWVGPERLRKVPEGSAQVGQRYEVQWQGKPYPATIARIDGGFHFVHYEGEAGEFDEWVTADKFLQPLEPARAHSATFTEGEQVAALWHEYWFLARIEAHRGLLYSVRYGDGDTGNLLATELKKVGLVPASGSPVLACWDNRPLMYTGIVVRSAPTGVTVRWDDGSPPSTVPTDQVACV